MNVTSSAALPAPQSAPRLAEPFQPMKKSPAKAEGAAETDEKKQKKRLFGFGRKKTSGEPLAQQQPNPQQQQPQPPTSDPSSSSNAPAPSTAATSPLQTGASARSVVMSASPRASHMSTSPRLSSPAGSQIFERDVQESATTLNLNLPNAPAIPSHIQTENYIPSVLDASSEAITDDHLDPDSVEIITHTSHQPAAAAVVAAASHSHGIVSAFPASASDAASWTDELAAFAEKQAVEDRASNYGGLDTADVRRLSFISFADVVQAEQLGHGGAIGSRDSLHLAGMTSLASVGLNRSPSPVRSPVSSSGLGEVGTSPPTSKSGSVKGIDMSPARKPLGSPTRTSTGMSSGGAAGPVVSGELNIETMSQALRRTGSTDLGGVRSPPISPI